MLTPEVDTLRSTMFFSFSEAQWEVNKGSGGNQGENDLNTRPMLSPQDMKLTVFQTSHAWETSHKTADMQRSGQTIGLNHSISFISPLRTIMSNSPLLIGWFWYEIQAWKQPRECRVSRKNTWQVCLLDVTDFSNKTSVLSSSWGPS